MLQRECFQADETKVELFWRNSLNYTCCKQATAYQRENIIPEKRLGGGRIMIKGCLAASGPEGLNNIEWEINSQV